MLDASFYVALAFLTVIGGLIYLKVPHRVLAMLDQRAKTIADEIARVEDLRKAAEALHAEYEAKREAAHAEAQEIVETARANAARMAEESREQLELQLKRRASQAEVKIARAQAQILKDVRMQASAMAIAAAEKIIAESFDESRHDALMSESIKNLENWLQ